MNKKELATGNLPTSQLLLQLDTALERSSTMRDIVVGCERLRMLESLNGTTRRTRLLQQEIARMESQLHFAR